MNSETTHRESKDFISSVISDSLLNEALNWIESNILPEDVYSEDVLKAWAKDNGFIEDDNNGL